MDPDHDKYFRRWSEVAKDCLVIAVFFFLGMGAQFLWQQVKEWKRISVQSELLCDRDRGVE